MCLYSTYNNRFLEEPNFQPIDRSVFGRSSECLIRSLSASVMCFPHSSSLSSLSSLPPVDISLTSIKIQQSFPQLLTHYPCLGAVSTN